MHSEDFARIMTALGDAGIVDVEQSLRAIDLYAEDRAKIEREAEERAAKLGYEKPFARLVMASDPILGMPLMFWALIFWLVVSWLI